MIGLPFSLVSTLFFGCESGDGDTSATDTGDSGTNTDTADTADSAETGDSGIPVVEGHVSFLADDQLNHLLPLQTAYDTTTRHIFTECNMFPTLGEVDLASQTLVAVHDVTEAGQRRNFLLAPGDGKVWIGAAGTPGLWTLDLDTEEIVPRDVGPDSMNAVAALPDGTFALLAGTNADGFTLVRVDGAFAVQATVPISETGYKLTVGPTGELAVLESVGGKFVITLRDPETLDVTQTCIDGGLGIPAEHPSDFEYMPNGEYLTVTDDLIMRSRCDGSAWSAARIGIENKQIFTWQNTTYIADRVGEGDAYDALRGELRKFDDEMNVVADFPTGHNSGFGAIDDDILWLNSEGTGEVWGVHLNDPAEYDTVKMGQHVESVAFDPENGEKIWFSGRLTNSVGWVNLSTGETALIDDTVRWPVAPIIAAGSLWVVSQTESKLYELDPESLDVLVGYDFGLSPDDLLTLDDSVWSENRGSIFFTASTDNVLIEFDPLRKVEVGRWSLSGDMLPDRNLPGRLEIVLDGDFAIVIRNNDGEMTRVDLGSGATTTAKLPDATVKTILANHLIDQTYPEVIGGTIYIGNLAFDAETLDPAPDRNIVGNVVAGELGGVPITWSRDLAGLQLAGTGAVLPMTTEYPDAPEFLWDAANSRMLYAESGHAAAYAVFVDSLLAQ